MTPLSRKLGIKEGSHILLLNQPEGYFEKIEIPASSLNQIQPGSGQKADFIHLFTLEENQLIQQLERAIPLLSQKGALWISWKKGIKSFNREVVRKIGLETDLVDVKVASFDEQWSALKFVYRLKDRK
jgi:hypothetical protein